jgi:hypothetical protein
MNGRALPGPLFGEPWRRPGKPIDPLSGLDLVSSEMDYFPPRNFDKRAFFHLWGRRMDSRRGRGAGSGGPAASLIEISRVLEETARLVREHAGETAGSGAQAPAADGVSPPQIRAILSLRALRREYLGLEVDDAAWTLMLEAYAARLEGRVVRQERLAHDAAVAPEAAAGAARALIEARIFIAEPDGGDEAPMRLALSDTAAERMRNYLAAAQRIGPMFA